MIGRICRSRDRDCFPAVLQNRNSKLLITSFSIDKAWTMTDDKIGPAEINASPLRMYQGHGTPTNNLDQNEAATTILQDVPGKPSDGKVSLGLRAPTDQIPERTWVVYLAWPFGRSLEHLNVLSQRNQCIRSQEGRTTVIYAVNKGRITGDINTGWTRTLGAVGFPYPSSFRKAIDGGTISAVSSEVRVRRVGSKMEQITVGPEGKKLGRSGTNHVTVNKRWNIGFETRWIALKRTSMTDWEGPLRPLYIVVGVFQRGHTNPRERVVFVHKPEHLFRKLGWATFRLRGVTGTFWSLKHVKGFGLYKVGFCWSMLPISH